MSHCYDSDVFPILIDTDPGVDDALAILFALAHPRFDVLGLTAVYGNVHTPLAADNALRLLELTGHTIPVALGARQPLQGHLDSVADFVHGDDGFGNTYLPQPTQRPLDTPAAAWMVEQINARPHSLWLIALGPLTNLAEALRLDPSIVHKVRGVLLMGGAFGVPGNVTPVGEANIHNDPIAADQVLTAGWSVHMMGLDVTEQLEMTEAYLLALRDRYPRIGGFLHSISEVYQSFACQQRGKRCVLAHDLAPLMYMIRPDLFDMRTGPVRVVPDGIAKGLTVQDQLQRKGSHHAWSNQPDVSVAYGIDAATALQVYQDTLAHLERALPSGDTT